MSHRVISLATTTFVAAAVLLAPTPVATAVVETCQGRPATIVGTGPEIVGTPGDDVIVSGASRAIRAEGGRRPRLPDPDRPRRVRDHGRRGAGDDTVDTTAFGDFARTDLGRAATATSGATDSSRSEPSASMMTCRPGRATTWSTSP